MFNVLGVGVGVAGWGLRGLGWGFGVASACCSFVGWGVGDLPRLEEWIWRQEEREAVVGGAPFTPNPTSLFLSRAKRNASAPAPDPTPHPHPQP